MKALDSDWSSLSHAYGAATDIPELLSRLDSYPASDGFRAEPFYSLWSSLCHQGDVYSASYESVPHIVRILASNPNRACYDYFLLPICIESSRLKNRGPVIHQSIELEYFQAIKLLVKLVPLISNPNGIYTRVLAATVAITNGSYVLGDFILELNETNIEELTQHL